MKNEISTSPESSIRRNFLGRTALSTAATVLAIGLAGCANSATSTTVEQVIATIQAWAPFVNAAALAISALVPAAANILKMVEDGVSATSAALNTMSSTMSTASAQSTVSGVLTYMKGSLAALDQMIVLVPAGNTRNSLQQLFNEANAVLPILTAFVTGVAPIVVGAELAPLPVPKHLWIRTVKS